MGLYLRSVWLELHRQQIRENMLTLLQKQRLIFLTMMAGQEAIRRPGVAVISPGWFQ